ncbi:MAG: methionyl-tRNA formyltransferase [Anaerolineae bacterium]|nr:methionyl-tRNA formyltransferase [Anaerolineae bacterium]
MMPRTVFMGSPEFALPALRSLATRYPVVGVVTQPDRPAGRGRQLSPPPVKLLAEELELPVIQPRRLSEPGAYDQLQQWAPELIIVTAFGQILRPAVLELPKYGCINVHGSLLPLWRGAAPIQAAILNGDNLTGITIMRMDSGIDTGPILSQKSLPINRDDNALSLAAKLAELGAELLDETLPRYLSGALTPTAQDENLATYAPMIKKEDGALNFSFPAIVLDRKVRAYNPWPGAFTYWNNQMLKIHRAHPIVGINGVAGKHTIYQDLPAIFTGEGLLVLEELQLSGRTSQSGKIFLLGVRNWES